MIGCRKVYCAVHLVRVMRIETGFPDDVATPDAFFPSDTATLTDQQSRAHLAC